MSSHAFILGGTGQIGLAAARAFLAAGWSVTLSTRSTPCPADLIELGAKVIWLDRDVKGELARALGGGADVLIDTCAYDDGHAARLLDLQSSVGSLIVVSSASVYRDQLGRTLDEAASCGFPELPDPIGEQQPTVDPGPTTYSTRKMALEALLLDRATVPVTILRPCAIYGIGSRHPREWWFVKRMLDGRPHIPLADRGASRFHTAAAVNIAALMRVAAERPGSRVLNIADPAAPNVAEIGRCIARHLGYTGSLVERDSPAQPTVGRSPWWVPRPFVVDCAAALALGYVPVATYAEAVGPVCNWLAATSQDGDWTQRFPVLAGYPRELFDYAAEDAHLAG